MPQVIYPSLVGYNELLKTIGNGGFEKVEQEIHLLTGEFVAIKRIDKAKLGSGINLAYLGTACGSPAYAAPINILHQIH
ncbi:unnamed protein product [Rotaria sp. Silwood2]|nr:unnamed protein product [Rotaria sp. Silwood2]CAF2604293.1 unnamed protein product [Rotaria sp. Silwood2]CAF2829738.1 unnamed protein product [Rotaria sp. Silwood2]CAF3926515.1 unnamed protein product [Rotaria sp. Silwood2]CAF4198524.1 unnamed protein product [Rotaria sp. Silwood2]